MRLEGYEVVAVMPWEAASDGKAVSCPSTKCAASLRYQGKPGWYKIDVEYFDQSNGIARFRLFVGGQLVDEWAASNRVPSIKIDGSTSTRRTISEVALRPGDEIRIEGMPDQGETAALDFIEIEAIEKR
jgi:alpha-glucuronidase